VDRDINFLNHSVEAAWPVDLEPLNTQRNKTPASDFEVTLVIDSTTVNT